MKKLNALTGIRAIAALWVASFHLFPETLRLFQSHHLQPLWLSGAMFMPIAKKGYLGVDLFFILSGFVLSLVHQKDFKFSIKKEVIFDFLGLRLARIYPVMFFALVLMVPFRLLLHQYGYNKHSENYSVLGFFCSLFMIQSWGFCYSGVWNGPAWSVSAEWFVYILFPFIAFVLSKIKKPFWNISLALGALLLLHYLSIEIFHQPAIVQLHLIDGGVSTLSRIAPEFIAGSCLYNIYSIYHLRPNWSDFIGIISIILIPIIFYSHQEYVDVFIVGLFTVLIFALSMPGKILKNIFGNRLMVHLGEISYSYYILHFLIISHGGLNLLVRIASRINGLQFFSFEIILLLLTLIAAECLYHWIEVPGRRIIRDKILIKGNAKLN